MCFGSSRLGWYCARESGTRQFDSKSTPRGNVVNEANFKRRIVDNIKARGGYARRIEDQFSVGFPDLIIQTSENMPVFFVEAKIVRGPVFGPSPRQYVEMKRLMVSRYAVPVLAGWDGKMLLHRRAVSAYVTDCFMQPDGCDFFDTLEQWYENERQQKSSG